jgi:CDGSH-type Zn-finger protein/uncharacterized Fe-S cluster protein YjdI
VKEKIHRYEGDEVEVTWDKLRCIHAAECVRGLPAVFDADQRPWVRPDQASAGEVVDVVRRCPTGALHVRRASGRPVDEAPRPNSLRVAADGPVYVRGEVEVRNADGDLLVADTRLALCRCGRSAHKPLCDDSHRKAEFRDRGTLQQTNLEDREQQGPGDDGEPRGLLVLKVSRNGPLVLDGPFTLTDAEDRTVGGEKAALCRCGASGNKPFCDGSHNRVGFRGD